MAAQVLTAERAPPGQACAPPANGLAVYARVRPLTSSEQAAGTTAHPGLQLQYTTGAVGALRAIDGLALNGFKAVIGQEVSNPEVFELTFAPQMQAALRGGSASMLCYGAPGSGRSFTIFGGGEGGEGPGLHKLAAERLLQDLSGTRDDTLLLRATAFEVSGDDKAADLMGPDRVSCTIKAGSNGQLQVLRQPEVRPLDATEAGMLTELLPAGEKPALEPASISVPGRLRAGLLKNAADLKHHFGAAGLLAGSHEAHVFVHLEISSEALAGAETALVEAEAVLAARTRALDNLKTIYFAALCDGNAGQRRVLQSPPLEEDAEEAKAFLGLAFPAEGCLDITSVQAGEDTESYILKGREADGAKTAQAWAAHLGVPALSAQTVAAKRELGDPGKWLSSRSRLVEVWRQLATLETDARRAAEAAAAEVARMQQGSPALGGSLLLGALTAEADGKLGPNLAALKDCLRLLSKGSSAKPKVKESVLTKVLEGSLAPTPKSAEVPRECAAVLLVTVSPVESILESSKQALRFGQAVAPKEAPVAATTPAAPVEPPKPLDKKIKEEIFQIYKEHCPEKTEHDVQVILYSFAGREEELLQKVREKYSGSK